MEEYFQQDVRMETQKQGNFLFLFLTFKNILPKRCNLALEDCICKKQKKRKKKSANPISEGLKMDYKTGDIRYRIVVDTGRADCNQDEMLQLCCTNAENAVDLYRDTVLELVLKSLEGPPNDAYIQKVKNTFNFFKDLKHEVVEILTSAFREERLATGGGVG